MKIKKNSPILSKIKNFKLGQKLWGFFVCIEKSYRISKIGTPYLDVTLSDISGKIGGKIWENADHFSSKFEVGNPVAVKGVPVEFNEQIQVNISQISFADSKIYNKYGFNPEFLIQSISENPENLYEQILININKFKSKNLKELCLDIFKQYKNYILISPASLKNHYPIKGGLILHLFNNLKLGLQCLKNHKFLDKDLLISGLILHDIGKIKCYSGEFIFIENDESKLVGSDILGLEIINESIQQLSDFPIEVKQKLTNIMMFHHKNIEDGDQNWKHFPEALVTFNINRMDAQIDIMNRVIFESKDLNGNWPNRRYHFETSLLVE